MKSKKEKRINLRINKEMYDKLKDLSIKNKTSLSKCMTNILKNVIQKGYLSDFVIQKDKNVIQNPEMYDKNQEMYDKNQEMYDKNQEMYDKNQEMYDKNPKVSDNLNKIEDIFK
jgi:ribosomal protein S8